MRSVKLSVPSEVVGAMSEKEEVYKMEPHNFSWHIMHWPVCVNCGLIMMKNPFSEWAQKVGCLNKLHPSYESKRGLTNPFK